ncbi:aldo/keto reductase [Streptomyces xanthochromogenes]|uniref:aldo/keto reductase n=1 Tax=Streptomyces xanthochromogenes TaxID=67384 RepID=UPI001E33CF76|nr:aldo/keto reductase [Streptomyces xanthochromogenes]
MTGTYGPIDPHEAAATVREALDSGITMFDTGDFYGEGPNEELIGRTLAPHRDRAILATKTGVRRTAEGLMPAGSPNELRRVCEASLRRLRTDHLDLYYLARVDPAVPVEESVGALADRFVLAGNSLGALVALQTAVTAPERVEGLVLIGYRPHDQPASPASASRLGR